TVSTRPSTSRWPSTTTYRSPSMTRRHCSPSRSAVRSGWIADARSRPGGDRPFRVVRPLRPRPRIQRGIDTSDGERRDLVGGGDAGTAVDRDRASAVGETFAQFIGAAEVAVGGEVLGGGCADGARDMTGAGVDRLLFAAETFAGPRIEQRTRPAGGG